MVESPAELGYRGPESLDPGVRKARGVYYTPPHVVAFILEQTLGKLLAGCREPGEAARLKILDPACGTGCFLLGACQFLLDWHGRHKAPGRRFRERIVEGSLFGVDIDAAALARARLLLGRLSGTRRPVENLRCGDSLIAESLAGSDRQVRPFDWPAEFPGVMKAGGFDCVVGNPPYVFTRDRRLGKAEKEYFNRTYRHQNYQLNTYALFIEKSLNLLKEGGHCGLIVPSNWLTVSSMRRFRDYLLGATGDLRIVNNCYRVFPGVSVDTAMVLFTRKKPGKVQLMESSGPRRFHQVATLPAGELIGRSVIPIGLYRDRVARRTVERVEARSRPLGEFCTVSTGLKAYQAGKGRPPQTGREKKQRSFHARRARDATCRRYLEGRDVCRYRLAWSGSYLAYGDWLAEPRRSVPFRGDRLLVRQIPARPPYLVHAVHTDRAYCHDINSMVIHSPREGLSIKYLLALVNSRLVSFWFMHRYDKLQRKIFPQFKVGELRHFPVVPIGTRNRDVHDRLVELVDDRLRAGESGGALDRQIDELVYALFGLSRKQIQHLER